ncbi:aldehyde dehydrogenase family protein [Colwellia sp. MSW7]|uniref:Aldehyde dehydrogenase family protein n=1 Tax=Colwellia maritima TaxID=2912588 RepID=A0ABS9WY85_9GAMM|nr:aldehyde dehydrogenase family protein [Colwellia maritima]
MKPGGFTAFDANSHQALATTFADATETEVNTAINRANEAFASYSQLSPEKRAHFLRTIGDKINALGDELITTACTETGLPAIRIQGERGRTVSQLGLFANLLEKGEYDTVIELADNDRQPLPKPDTRLGYLPLGVVGVFAASNFPLAFSTAWWRHCIGPRCGLPCSDESSCCPPCYCRISGTSHFSGY